MKAIVVTVNDIQLTLLVYGQAGGAGQGVGIPGNLPDKFHGAAGRWLAGRLNSKGTGGAIVAVAAGVGVLVAAASGVAAGVTAAIVAGVLSLPAHAASRCASKKPIKIAISFFIIGYNASLWGL